jgi:tetratricopeptide (TPR) repeat protein
MRYQNHAAVGRAPTTCRWFARLLVAGFAAAFWLPSLAAAADAPPKPNKKVSAALSAANQAIAAKNFALASAKIAEAQAIPKREPIDDYNIDESRIYLYQEQGGSPPELLAILEKSLQTPQFFSGDGVDRRQRAIIQVSYNTKQYSKAIDYCKRWLQAHPDDKPIMELLGNSYYLTQDYKGTLEVMQGLSALAEKLGEMPKESWLGLTLSANSYLQDTQGVIASYEKLLRYYPKRDYWQRYLSQITRGERSPAAMTQWFRLMYETDTLRSADEYVEFANLLVQDEASPAEALRVVQRGFERKTLGADDKSKAQHEALLASVQKKAIADQASLVAEEKLQRANSTAAADAGLGLAYFSQEKYDQAIASLERGLNKGGLKNPDRYRFALGIAHFSKGNREQSRVAFGAIPADSPLARPAHAWLLRTQN